VPGPDLRRAAEGARPRCARLAAWANAVLLGAVSPDTAGERITGDDPPHRVDGLPGGADQSLPVALARLRGAGVRGLRLVLPAPGDPVGLPGPGPFTSAALLAGGGVIVEGRTGPIGLVPEESAGAVRWHAWSLPPDEPRPDNPGLAEADQALARALREATDLLTARDLARADPEADSALAALRDGRLDGDGLPPGYPDRAQGVLVRARRLAAVVRLAAGSDGGAVTAAEAALRREALLGLERAARHAEVAAHNAVLERPADGLTRPVE